VEQNVQDDDQQDQAADADIHGLTPYSGLRIKRFSF
jgi:hypothetical protein